MSKISSEMASGGVSPTSTYTELNKLIYEYLEIAGMNQTLSSFVSECENKSLPCLSKDSPPKLNFTPSDSTALLKSFDDGNLEIFLEKWKLFLKHIQITSEDMRKLEVYLRVYFAIWPKAHDAPESEQLKAMVGLKAYFEEYSSELSRDPTILPLFALPFVSDPKSHPVFKELFQTLWTGRLRAQLEATLVKYFDLLQDNIACHSKLAAIVNQSKCRKPDQQKSVTDYVTRYHKDRFYQLMTTYRKIRKLLRGTRESYGKLLKVSNELVCGLEDAVNGSVQSVEPTIQKCFEIFPELFTPGHVDSNERPDKEYFKRLASAAIFNNILDSDVSLFFIGISDLGPEALNYPKIKETLISEDVPSSEKLCLLQSLRWLLTKSSPKCREHAMKAFVSADLLGLKSKDKDYRNKLFSSMLTTTPTYMKECLARLLNAFASIKTGRGYLSLNDYCLDVLVRSLITFKGETESYIAQMVIAALQKMSLKKKMRLGMIERKVIQWLAVYLKAELVKRKVSRLSDRVETTYIPYLMEYGWALLMNLCLHEEAKVASSAIAADILSSVVQMLMAKPAPEIAPYVVSTLYSLLRNPDVFVIAKRMRLQDTLTEIVGNSKTEMAIHIKKLVDVLNTKGHDRITSTGEVDYDDDENGDPEEFEPELEVSESWVASMDKDNHTGDDLLVRQYLIHREIVLPRTPFPKNQVQGVYNRPTTPKGLQMSKNGGSRSPYYPIKFTPRESITSASVSKAKIVDSKSQTQSNVKPRTQIKTPIATANLSKPDSPTAANAKSKLISSLPNTAMKNKPNQRFDPLPLVDLLDKGKTNPGTSILNLVTGKYKNFDNGMYFDDIFASVTPITPILPNTKAKDSPSKERLTTTTTGPATNEMNDNNNTTA